MLRTCPFLCRCLTGLGQKKALTTHHAITHLGRREFVCAAEGCGRAFGYKHILQRHQARRHSNDRAEANGQHNDADGESSEVEQPRPKKQKTRHEPSPGTSTINEITGVAYAERAARRPVQLKCPYPAMEGLPSALPVESTSLWGDAGPCEYVFGRAYDLRRHLRAVHGIWIEKDVVDSWAGSRTAGQSRD
jgi:general transcription factor IIIA